LESNLGGDLGAGYLYALAKYGGGQDRGPSVIYYLGGVALDIPNQAPTGQWGLSHVTLFNPGNNVPDGGTTAVLLGLGMLGLSMFRRKS
ncbi:MAG TPA: VPDSG-CTERM sorting domain-containing protein, partial [Candidatus Kapabacteria bacterium]|nr:VPDSG-CTERM sorting domain-containing protein [Candidatus Kapabacteria bacterium]